MKLIVGLTGGIACGKSYVSSYLEKLNYKVIDTDKISKSLYLDKDYLNKLEYEFSDCFNNHILNKEKLKEEVFSSNSKLEKLNRIAHPLILSKTKEEILKNDGIIFIDAPLLYEANFDKLCDVTICVYTSKDIQLKRLLLRDHIDKNLASKIIDSQLDLEIKKSKANILIESCEDYNETNKNILNALERINDYVKSLWNKRKC